MIMESMSASVSTSSSSSSPSISNGSNEQNDLISLVNEELNKRDFVNAIKLLTNAIDIKLFRISNNNNINNNNNNINTNNISNNESKELSQLYAIRSQSYLKLGLHQLAFDDSINGLKFNNNNENCFYFKGCAELCLNQRASAEQSFEMALKIRKNFSEASKELVDIRKQALKEAGFDEETANKYAPKCNSVNDAIDAILSRSLTANELSDLRASYTRSLSNTNQSLSPGVGNVSAMSGIFGSSSGSNSNTNTNNSASESLGLKLISDIDNCLGSILDSDDELAQKSNSILKSSATNSNNNKFCDIGDNNLLSRSLSPQSTQKATQKSTQIFGIDLLKPKPNSFAIDLNKDSLGSQIVPKNSNTFNGITAAANPPKKTFADIASSNTIKPVQPPKMFPNFTPKTITNGKNSEKIDTKDILTSRPIKVFDSGNKVSSLESFSIPTAEEKVIPNVLTNTDMKPTNLMAYKGLWVCNISPEVSYITLKKVFRKYGNFTGIQTFERKATNGSNIVFVHYDNSQSPTDAIAELFGIYRKDICFDESTPLKLRYTPSMEQTKSGDLPSMEKAKRIVEKSGECFNWRLSSGCHKGDRCNLKHILINKSIDSQPWVKALKKKANET